MGLVRKAEKDIKLFEKVVDTTSAKILASFHPQAWLNGCAIGVDAGGQCSWSIDLSDLDAEEDSNDYLVGTSEAPSWIKSWSGPFEITLFCEKEGVE